jgi:GTP-binding protein HflX
VRAQRSLYRQRRQRSGIPIVALVGYTNSGKSTLLNALSQAGVASEDRPFTTLDPTTRRVHIPNDGTILLSDTVGFIRKLPPAIVSAFRATLEELEDADLLLNVVDFSSPYAAEESQTVEDVLKDLALADRRRITVLNKVDRLIDINAAGAEQETLAALQSLHPQSDPDTVFTSATRKWGLTALLKRVGEITAAAPSEIPGT